MNTLKKKASYYYLCYALFFQSFLFVHHFLSAGFSQGVRRSVGGLATILGPLWAGGLTDNLYIMLGVMMALLALLMVRRWTPHPNHVSCLWLCEA